MSWDRVETLLNVIHSAATAGPKYQYIVGIAEAELTALMAEVSGEAEVKAVSEPISHGDQSPEDHPPASPSGDGEPGPDATMTTIVERRV